MDLKDTALFKDNIGPGILSKAAQAEKEEYVEPSTEDEQFPENMTTLQCFWKVTTIASPIIFSMLVYLFV